MPDFSLVPVDHQPDFSDFSLIPVDYDPFSADGAIQQARTRQAQAQPESQPQSLANGASQPNVGALTNNAEAAASGESYDPNADSVSGVPGSSQPYNPTAASMSSSDKPTVDWSRYNQPSGELKAATYTPTQQIGNVVADALIGLGMQPYTANDLTTRIGNVLGLSPLGVLGSAFDLIDAKRRDDFPGVVTAAAGMIPGAKGVARGVAANAIHLHHAWPKYLGGPVKQDLVPLPKSYMRSSTRVWTKALVPQRGSRHSNILRHTPKISMQSTARSFMMRCLKTGFLHHDREHQAG